MDPEGYFSFRKAVESVICEAARRGTRLLLKPVARLFALNHILQQLPGVQSAYLDLDGNSTDPNYNYFIAGPPPSQYPTDDEKVKADINNFISSTIYYRLWVERAHQIRLSGRREDCIGNLSIALNVGAAYGAGADQRKHRS